MNIVAPILDSSSQTFTYFDVTLNDFNTIATYTGDWEYENKKITSNINDSSFQCSFIAIEKR